MEEEEKKDLKAGWIYVPDRKTIWSDRTGEHCTSYLSGERVSGISVGGLEFNKRIQRKPQQVRKPINR